MGLLDLYTYPRWEDGPDDELTYEWPDEPDQTAEILTVSGVTVWWTASMIDSDVD